MANLEQRIEEVVANAIESFGMGTIGFTLPNSDMGRNGLIEVRASWTDTIDHFPGTGEEPDPEFYAEDHPSKHDASDFQKLLQDKIDREGLPLDVDSVEIKETEITEEHHGIVITTPLFVELVRLEGPFRSLKTAAKAGAKQEIDELYNDYYGAIARGASSEELQDILDQMGEPFDLLDKQFKQIREQLFEAFRSGAYQAVISNANTLSKIIDDYEDTLSYVNDKEELTDRQWIWHSDYFVYQLEPKRLDLKQLRKDWANVLGTLEELGMKV